MPAGLTSRTYIRSHPTHMRPLSFVFTTYSSQSHISANTLITIIMSTPFPDLPISGITFPRSPIAIAAFAYTQKHTTEAVYNHCVRSAYWALLLAKKLKPLADRKPNLETVVLACIMHDMGWATDKSMLSTWKRFEVDAADIAKRFVEGYKGEGASEWTEERVQTVWNCIALHTTSSIAPFASVEVATAHLGVIADFIGPQFPSSPWTDPTTTAPDAAPGSVITVEEFREVAAAFPYAGFGEKFCREILCATCRDKPIATFDNFVGIFGREFGTDGQGGGKEEYFEAWKKVNSADSWTGGFAYLESLLADSGN
ncbi:metal dependent phosphohydrolase [Xylariaceae sp. FL1019]|nr:metal dependent phosphohydrolase [Xylariaceae sp. FL1019]